MRLATDDDLSAADGLAPGEPPLVGYRADILGHPAAGRCLRNYVILTDRPELVAGLGLTAGERFWSRYYWLARLAREWQAAAGYDAGLEQMVFKLLVSAEDAGVGYDPLPEVDAAVERDTAARPPG